MNYTLHNVTKDADAWFNKDPVRPGLTIEFRTKGGREVFGLMNEDGEYKAFMCVAYTTAVPSSVVEMDVLTSVNGSIAVPYTVWSYQRGAGKEIINQLLSLVSEQKRVERVVTLSPLTKMARRFHTRNNAVELRVNETTVNFEYSTPPTI
jgi:hypothetical protein